MSEYKNINEESLTGNLDINKIVGKLFLYKYVILFCILIGLGAGWAQSRYTRPTYSIGASLLAKGDKPAGAASILSGAALATDNKTIMDEISIIKSFPFMLEVVKELDLQVSYFSQGRFIDIELYKRSPFRVDLSNCAQLPSQAFYVQINTDSTFVLSRKKESSSEESNGARHRFGQEFLLSGDCKCKLYLSRDIDDVNFDTKYFFIFNDIYALAKYYADAVNIRNVNGSLLNFSITSSVPQREEDFLNLLMDEYIEYTLQLKNETFIKTIEFIDLQLGQISDSLYNVENRLERFRQDNKLGFGKDGDGDNMTRLLAFEEERLRLQMSEKYIDYLEGYINQSEDYEKIATPNMANVENQLIGGLIGELVNLQMEKSTYLKNAKERNPFLEEVNAKIKSARQALIEAIATTRSVNKITLQNIENRIALLKREANTLPRAQRELVGINRLYTINEGIYLTLLQKRLEADVSRAAATVDSKVVQPAFTAARLGPNEMRNYGIGAFTGFLIPVLFIFVKEFFRGTIETTDELERISPVTLFGTVLHDQNKKGEAVTIVQRPKSALAESFRSLRSNLSFVLGGSTEPKVLLVTSSIPGEGKSFCSTNLSVILSLSGKKVVHIVADLRKPKVYIELDETAQADDAGLSNYLSATANLDQVLRKTSAPSLDIIPSGPVPPNPAELLMSDRMEELINELKQRYDYIIIDTPPVGLVSDAFSLMRFSHANLYVVRHKYTPAERIKVLNKMYREGKIGKLGFVFNDMARKTRGYGYGYGGYGYGTNYGYGYYDEIDDKKIWWKRLISELTGR